MRLSYVACLACSRLLVGIVSLSPKIFTDEGLEVIFEIHGACEQGCAGHTSLVGPPTDTIAAWHADLTCCRLVYRVRGATFCIT